MKFLKSKLEWKKVGNEWQATVPYKDQSYVVRIGASLLRPGPPEENWKICDLGPLSDNGEPRKHLLATKQLGSAEGIQVMLVKNEVSHLVGGGDDVAVVKIKFPYSEPVWTFKDRITPSQRTVESLLKAYQVMVDPVFRRKPAKRGPEYKLAVKRKTEWYRRFKQIADAVKDPADVEAVLRTAHDVLDGARAFKHSWMSHAAKDAMELVLSDLRAKN